MTDLIRRKFGMWVALARTEVVNAITHVARGIDVARGMDVARGTPKYHRFIF